MPLSATVVLKAYFVKHSLAFLLAYSDHKTRIGFSSYSVWNVKKFLPVILC